MADDHHIRIETHDSLETATHVACCSCGWEGRRERSAERAEARGALHVMKIELLREYAAPPILEEDPPEDETEYTSEPIDLSDALKTISWLRGERVHAHILVGKHARASISGVMSGARTSSAGGIDIRFKTRSMSTTFEVSDEPFISGSIFGRMLEIRFSDSRILLVTSALQDAWRHVQISKRWLAEQPPNDALERSSDTPRLRRIGYQ
jgi:hypothetical protein